MKEFFLGLFGVLLGVSLCANAVLAYRIFLAPEDDPAVTEETVIQPEEQPAAEQDIVTAVQNEQQEMIRTAMVDAGNK